MAGDALKKCRQLRQLGSESGFIERSTSLKSRLSKSRPHNPSRFQKSPKTCVDKKKPNATLTITPIVNA
jgi:hypothetical protein